MAYTESFGHSIQPINCEQCGSPLTDVDYDKKGRLVSRCPNRFKDLESPLPPARELARRHVRNAAPVELHKCGAVDLS